MVDLTSNLTSVNTDAPDYIDMDQLDSTATIFYSNMFALIKLRKNEGASSLSKV